MASPHDIAIRGSVPPPSMNATGPSHSATLAEGGHDAPGSRSPSDVWAGAIARLQTQVSYNTGMLDSHRRQVADIEQAVGRLQHEMGNVIAVLNELRAEVHSRPAVTEGVKHDPGDLEVLTDQVAVVTHKANEVDGLKMQIELMKNRIKRFEDHGSPLAPGQRPDTSSSHLERPLYDPSAAQPRPTHRLQLQTLPPMRTGSLHSPDDERQRHIYPQPPMVPSQVPPAYHQSPVSQTLSSEHASMQSSAAPGFRPAEPLPPPSAISGWRPAEPHQSNLPVPPPPPQHQVQLRSSESEPHGSGWAAVNVNQAPKRPFDEYGRSPYENSFPGSPKRPKLAPIMPRSMHGDETYVPTPSSYQQTASSATPDASFNSRSRAPSDCDATHLQSQAFPAAATASLNAYRFITSTAQTDRQDPWRPEAEGILPPQPTAGGWGKGRGRRGRGRGGRGGRGGAHGHHSDSQELGAPDLERPDFQGSFVSPNGYYNSTQPAQGGVVQRSDGFPGGSMDRPLHDLPATPIQGPHDPFGAGQGDDISMSGGKKSRTKPIRNAEGVLIRKDGRPDMRSVSSANNLRKVHAKKEAERNADLTEGRTPTSARSLAPAHSNSMSDEPEDGSSADREEQQEYHADTQERHRQLTSKIFPHGVEYVKTEDGDIDAPPREVARRDDSHDVTMHDAGEDAKETVLREEAEGEAAGPEAEDEARLNPSAIDTERVS